LSGGVLWLLASSLFAADYYVAPGASAGGIGSLGNPWTLAVALGQPSVLRPGDTIWMRGGT
jgi:hypothetical protein